MKKKSESVLNAWTRALVILITLLAVCYLAVMGNSQIAPLAAGALISALVAAITYEFRGRIESTEPPSADADTVTVMAKPVKSAPVAKLVDAPSALERAAGQDSGVQR